MKPKVLMVIDFAPDYRERFFQKLGQECDLTVVAQNPDIGGLTPPIERIGYNYVELPSKIFFGFVWQPGLANLFKKNEWDVFCIGSNLRHFDRLLIFLKNKSYRKKWVWRGQMFGRSASNKFVLKFRKYLLEKAAISLTYNIEERDRLRSFVRGEINTFNNSEVSLQEFREPSFLNTDTLNLLFVGRNQPRKKIERLINLAQENEKIRVRLIGPNMDQLSIPDILKKTGRVVVFDGMRGNALNEHFDWCHLVANPGHLGLLVLNASRHGKPIVVDSSSSHAPEVEVAKRSNQFFLDFTDQVAVNKFFSDLVTSKTELKKVGLELQSLAKKEYTIEYMVEAHTAAFTYALSMQKGL